MWKTCVSLCVGLGFDPRSCCALLSTLVGKQDWASSPSNEEEKNVGICMLLADNVKDPLAVRSERRAVNIFLVARQTSYILTIVSWKVHTKRSVHTGVRLGSVARVTVVALLSQGDLDLTIPRGLVRANEHESITERMANFCVTVNGAFRRT